MADVNNAETDPAYVIDAVIRVPDAATAEWVVRQLAALLADRADGARLDTAGIFTAEVYDAEATDGPAHA